MRQELERDRIHNRRESLMHFPSIQMMDEFIQGSAQLPNGPASASPFAMEQMRRELDQATRRHSSSPQNWAGEFDPGIPEQQGMVDPTFARPANSGFSAADFSRFQQRSPNVRTGSPMSASANQTPMQGYRPMMNNYGGMSMGMGMGGMGMGMGMGMQQNYNQGFAQQRPMNQDYQGKGKERMVELDDTEWESQFASLEQVDQTATEEDVLSDEAAAKMEEELNAMDRSVAPQEENQETETDHFGDFESIWRGIQAETSTARNLVSEERFDMGDQDAFDQWEGFDGLNTARDPSLGDYVFESSTENPFTSLADPFAEGQKIMLEGGNLSLAALAFEAAVQKAPDHAAAWTALGSAQAQNEKESPAIRALEQALKLDPSNLDALMGLAVSYTNEGYDSTAYRTLERWLSTKYPSLASPDALSQAQDMGFTDRHLLHEKVTDLFIRAAQLSPAGDQMDPDVQVGLGVLFYGAEEYDKAVDCFGAALASTEEGSTNNASQLHLLWNRLGATLANSGRSEEAIDAYSRALELRPNFVRARYNLGVSCINIGCFEEAAQHLLGALAMHKVVEQEGLERVREVTGAGAGGAGGLSDDRLEEMILQNQSTNLYDTLRRVFAQMDRRDLQDLVGPGMDLEAVRREFEF